LPLTFCLALSPAACACDRAAHGLVSFKENFRLDWRNSGPLSRLVPTPTAQPPPDAPHRLPIVNGAMRAAQGDRPSMSDMPAAADRNVSLRRYASRPLAAGRRRLLGAIAATEIGALATTGQAAAIWRLADLAAACQNSLGAQ